MTAVAVIIVVAGGVFFFQGIGVIGTRYAYVFVGGLALLAWLLIASFTRLSLTATLLVLLVPMPIASVLFARHAKALWLALDHFVDPHRRRGPARR